MNPLVQVGKLDLTGADRIDRHRYVREAMSLIRAKIKVESEETVIATTNRPDPMVELYGWAPMVGKHQDNTGYIYFAPLVMRSSLVFTEYGSVLLELGGIYRLHDYAPHGTYDEGPVVALFWGPLDEPRDTAALAYLRRGLAALLEGRSDAPRVAERFRYPMSDECWVGDRDGTRIMLRREAERENHLIAQCALCNRVAWHIDHSFPYHADYNRCIRHFAQDWKIKLQGRDHRTQILAAVEAANETQRKERGSLAFQVNRVYHAGNE